MKMLGAYWYYFLLSVKNRGIRTTLKLLWYEWQADRKLGIQTRAISVKEQETESRLERSHHYQAVSYYIMLHLLGQIQSNIKDLGFLDFGCGKGRAMAMAAEFGFPRVDGVEFDKSLIPDLEHNIEILRKRYPESLFSYRLEDAALYQIAAYQNVFFFFNPFDDSILRKVLENINNSLVAAPRSVWLIYVNPLYESVLSQNGFHKTHWLQSAEYMEYVIYRNREY